MDTAGKIVMVRLEYLAYFHQIRTLRGHGDEVRSLTVLANGYLASG